MTVSPLAGKPAPPELLIDPARLEREYHTRRPDVDDTGQLVSFGTSGHRGSPLRGTFTEAHVLAVAQAVCDYRRSQGVNGPLFLGKDTHAVSGPAQRTTLEVLAANGVETVFQRDDGATPTPVISHAILAHNRGDTNHLADGVVITPSHNPPADGGFKYNPPNGGPADTAATRWIEERANEYLLRDNAGVRRVPYETALRAPTTRADDFATAYVADLRAVIDVAAIRRTGVRIGAAPLGGAAAAYWDRIAAEYGLDIEVVGPGADPTFAAVPVDHDGQIRMDCSSPYAMAGLVALKDRFAVAVGTDPDADRHGIVTPTAGLMNPNHYLAVAVRYLLTHRPAWPAGAAVGKTVVTSGLIDRVAERLGRAVCEVPVGFKWFARGLFDGTLVFGGEESAGASFLRHDGAVWTTDKDGILLALLAAEITAVTGKNPGEHYRELAAEVGTPYYTRLDAPATPGQKARLRKLSDTDVPVSALGGDPITAVLTRAPGNDEPIGGLKVVTAAGWFAARPSGTEDVYKLYAESFRSPTHLDAIVEDGRRIVAAALADHS
ncbi:alpha-D-glucose phosphate-specific phosphoglucomutase [bacterium]|nr:alpha-D-glucose phosphate-specific phosphoglucomutase [bacterium]